MNAQMARLLWIHGRLKRGQHVTIRMITARLEVSRRTAMRDMRLLREGFNQPIRYCPVRQTYELTRPVEALCSGLPLEQTEEAAVLLACEAASGLPDFPYRTALGRVVERLCRNSVDSDRGGLNRLRSSFEFRVGPRERSIPIDSLEVALRAVRERRPLLVRHQDGTREEIHPDRLALGPQLKWVLKGRTAFGSDKSFQLASLVDVELSKPDNTVRNPDLKAGGGSHNIDQDLTNLTSEQGSATQ